MSQCRKGVEGTKTSEQTDEELQYHTSRILGCQNIDHYTGWTPSNPEAIEEEFQRNKEKGIKEGRWQASTLVEKEGSKECDS